MFAGTVVPKGSNQYRLLRPISIVLLGLLQGLNQDQSLNCIWVEAMVTHI